MSDTEKRTDVLIVGGGTGGIAAALAVARNGGRCIVTEPTDWVGGQLTAQAVPPDENRWIEGTDGVQSAPRSYLEFREAVRRWYRDNRPLTDAARDNPRLNPGNGWVSHLCFEPAVGHAALQEMLAPHVAAGRIEILLGVEPVAAETQGDRVTAVTVAGPQGENRRTIAARFFLDAAETGDLFPLTGVECAIGAEAQSEHGELHAPPVADPYDQQAVSWCFALEHRPGENHVINRPPDYAFWRSFVPQLDIPWPGPLFSWTVVGGDEHQARTFRFLPCPDEPNAGEWEMWRYRRISDASICRRNPDGTPPFPDVALINMVQMDYFLKPTLGVPKEQQRLAFNEARNQSLAFLYWMQTEAPRHDGSGNGYPGLKLSGDALGTSDGFAKYPYIREARRLRARTIVTEAHVGTEQREQEGRASTADVPWGTGEPFADSVGIGHYRLDLHPSTAMRNSIYVHAAPFRVPLGALIPQRVRNLIAAGKNIGVTHITNGCYRLHPVEWTVGEAAGVLAQTCVSRDLEPQQVHEDLSRVRELQSLLASQGMPLAWPWENGAGL